jgi:hypothetical protein
MFVAFFGYPAYPMKMKKIEEKQRRKYIKSGNASFPLFLIAFYLLF